MRASRRLRERLRAIAGRSDDDAPPAPRSRVRLASFEHSHRVAPFEPPPRRWFVEQGIVRAEDELKMKRRWFR